MEPRRFKEKGSGKIGKYFKSLPTICPILHRFYQILSFKEGGSPTQETGLSIQFLVRSDILIKTTTLGCPGSRLKGRSFVVLRGESDRQPDRVVTDWRGVPRTSPVVSRLSFRCRSSHSTRCHERLVCSTNRACFRCDVLSLIKRSWHIETGSGVTKCHFLFSWSQFLIHL